MAWFGHPRYFYPALTPPFQQNQEQPMATKPTVMVTDHDKDIALLMEEVLLAEGYVVCRCPGAHLTADAIEAALPDIVIVDMGRADVCAALALIERLRQHPLTRHVAVLVSSTDTRLLGELSEPLRELRCAALPKPFDLDDFLAQVGQVACRDNAAQGAHP
jgi:CheY-like chemotaxis protein